MAVGVSVSGALGVGRGLLGVVACGGLVTDLASDQNGWREKYSRQSP
jgi:hypothetical protein